jgi:hypothetical protein
MTAIDWSTAEVHDRTLEVKIDSKAKKAWTGRFRAVVGQLDRAGHDWGEISIAKGTISVQAVQPGSEDTLRHLLEATAQQVNADLEQPEDSADDEDQRSAADREMTEAFRAFAPDSDSEQPSVRHGD